MPANFFYISRKNNIITFLAIYMISYMEAIQSQLNIIYNNGCSVNDILNLTNVIKLFFSNSGYNKLSSSIINFIFHLPLFCNEVFKLFDIMLSGLLMTDNSDDLWSKWICNRLVIHQIIPSDSLYRDDLILYIKELANKDITVKALLMLKNIMVPAFSNNKEELVNQRRAYRLAIIWLIDNFSEWIQSPIINPLSTIPIFSKIPGYHLTYHHGNNSFLLQFQAQLYSRLLEYSFKLSSLDIVKNNIVNKKTKIGFVSRSLSNHSVGKISVGLIEQLSLHNFETYIYTLDQRHEIIGNAIAQSCYKYVTPSNILMDWITKIKEDELNVLVILDPIMDINTYLIGCFRLAPVQISTWGHPDTTGLPYIDYYISSSLFESLNDDYHTEKLVCFPSLSIYYHHINDYLGFDSLKLLHNTGKTNIRKQLGIEENGCIYGIVGSMIKMSNDMDEIINKILDKDSNGWIVLIEGKDKDLFEVVYQRLRKNITHFERIKIVPQQPDVMHYLQLVYSFDVVLDTHPFGGCISTYECFMIGRIVVTLPGNKLYGRFTQGLYRKMGICEPIAKNIDDYIDIAVRIANNDIYRSTMENEILDKLHLIIKDDESIRDWIDFLNNIVKISN